MRQNAWESPNETYSRNEPSPSGLLLPMIGMKHSDLHYTKPAAPLSQFRGVFSCFVTWDQSSLKIRPMLVRV